MQKEYSREEKIAWLAAQPRKPLSGKVLVFNEQGETLLVRPNYKPGWDIVGGMLNEAESPLQGAIREIKEEIGHELPAERFGFLGVRYGISQESKGDFVHFIFKLSLTQGEIAEIVLEETEILEAQWVAPAEAKELLEGNLRQILSRMLDGEAGIYSENDQLVLGGSNAA
ncbi:MAG TPA: NUDIX hydrolase [Candidatus Saccharimonadales bacterium]